MIAAENEAAQNDFDLDRFYDVAIELTGYPPEIALFDPQLADALNTDWLIERAAIEEGVGADDVRKLLDEGLVRVWTAPTGGLHHVQHAPGRRVHEAESDRPLRSRGTATYRGILG